MFSYGKMDSRDEEDNSYWLYEAEVFEVVGEVFVVVFSNRFMMRLRCENRRIIKDFLE